MAQSERMRQSSQHSYAARRAGRGEADKFIAPLHWSGSRLLPAIGLALRRGTQDWTRLHRAKLAPLRHHIKDLVRYGGLDADHDFVVLYFSAPQSFEAELMAPFLPLQWNENVQLTNLGCKGFDAASLNQHKAAPLDIYWQGARRRLVPEQSVQLDRFVLWTMPEIERHAAWKLPLRPSRSAASGAVSDGENAVRAVGVSQDVAKLFGEHEEIFADLNALAPDDPGKRRRKGKGWGRDEARGDRGTGRNRFGLSEIFARLFNRQPIGEASEGANNAGRGAAANREEPHDRSAPIAVGPPLTERLRGWLYWNTPLGDGIRKQYSERLSKVTDLIQRGDMDEALKYALGMAQKLADREARKQQKIYPTQLPPPRAVLDFEISPEQGVSPILGDIMHDNIIDEYRKMARKLSEMGDHRRAAFVYAKLLGQYDEAIEELEKGEHYAQAAQLALKTRMPIAMIVRLYYLAGDHERALTLAQRFECFADLADSAKDHHPHFYAFVIEKWTDQLAATDQWIDALRASDALAKRPLHCAQIAQLIERRRQWAHHAVEDVGVIDEYVLLYGLLYGTWPTGSLDGAWVRRGVDERYGPIRAVLSDLREWLQEQDRINGRKFDRFITLLCQHGDPKRVDQQDFWRHGAKALIDPLVRHVVARQAASLPRAVRQDLGKLARQAGLMVLAEDLKKLKLQTVKRTGDISLDFNIALSGPVRAPVRYAACLGNGRILAWRRSRQLELWDKDGTLLWSTQLGGICAIIAMGTSPYAILVQDESIDAGAGKTQRRLIRFDGRKKHLMVLGTYDLRAWHDASSESQWLVQIGNEVGGLDLVKLLRERAPEAQFIWRAHLTSNLKIIAFFTVPGVNNSWITFDTADGALGLLEYWCYQTLQDKVEVRSYSYDDIEYRPARWYWLNHYVFGDVRFQEKSVTGYWAFMGTDGAAAAWNKLKEMTASAPLWCPQILSCDLQRIAVYIDAPRQGDGNCNDEDAAGGGAGDGDGTAAGGAGGGNNSGADSGGSAGDGARGSTGDGGDVVSDASATMNTGHGPRAAQLRPMPQSGTVLRMTWHQLSLQMALHLERDVTLELMARAPGMEGEIIFALEDGGLVIVDCSRRDIIRL